MNDYLIHFTKRDLQLIVDALNYYSRQNLFARQADWAACMAEELDAFQERQDTEFAQGVKEGRA